MSTTPAIEIAHLAHRYGEHVAIGDLSFSVAEGEIFALLGPNGSGKTTLFRVLSTLIALQQGEVTILGHDLRKQADAIRGQIGVVFQAASVDKKLTVAQNIHHSTGLDPGARSDLWQYLLQVRDTDGVTVVLTTHLLDEAQRADRIAIMHRGELAALDTPAALQASVGGDAITIRTTDAQALAADIGQRFNCTPMVVDGTVRLEQPDGHQWIPRLMEAYANRIDAITLGKPTLEDVFIHA